MGEMSVEEKNRAGIGFNVGSQHIFRLDRETDQGLSDIRSGLLDLQDQVREALLAISSVQGARYDADTVSRIGRYALE